MVNSSVLNPIQNTKKVFRTHLSVSSFEYINGLSFHKPRNESHQEYAGAGYDPEDARVSQLRQLVAAAEERSSAWEKNTLRLNTKTGDLLPLVIKTFFLKSLWSSSNLLLPAFYLSPPVQQANQIQDEIIDMRLRLQSCAEYTRQSMHGLTRREVTDMNPEQLC